MKQRAVPCLCALLLAVTFMAEAQSAPTLGLTATPVKVDGVFSDKEYSLVSDAAGMKLGLTWTADTVFVGLSAPTTGWVAVGLDSGKMDGSIMYIGYVSGDTTELKVQKGTGHRHADTDTNAPRTYAMKQRDGRTVLEIAVKASEIIAKGQKSLDLLVAMGGADSFVSMHKARASLSVGLAP
jgi:hypothetical protein